MASSKEFLDSIVSKPNENGKATVNRFSKKTFNDTLLALANDLEFKEELAKKSGTDECTISEVMVTKEFRKWVKKLVESLGIDSSESKVVLTDEFHIESMDGLYDFFMAAMYEYLVRGNRFEFPTHEDFKASITIKNVEEKVKTINARNPITGEDLGSYEKTVKAHKELSVKSSAPSWLSKKRLS